MSELLQTLRWKYYDSKIFGVNIFKGHYHVVCIRFDASIIAKMIENYEIARKLKRLTDI